MPFIQRRLRRRRDEIATLGAQPRRLPRGQLRAPARRPVPARRSACPATTTPAAWHAWGERGEAAVLQQPASTTSRTCGGDHLDWLRGRLSACCWSCGQGQWEDTTGSLESTRAARPRCSPSKGIRHELDLWGHDVPHDWPSWRANSRTTCRGSADRGPAPSDRTEHLIGLLLGTEEDWPRAFETLVRAARARSATRGGTTHTCDTERITIEPFDLRDRPRYDLVIDRLAYWYYHPREWLKKVALMDDVYLLNSPFTFQSMEKHSAYCAMIRLGLQDPGDRAGARTRTRSTTRSGRTPRETYNRPFDLDAIAARVGYPMFMKPFDGGAWRGVSRIDDSADAAPRLRRVRPDADAPAGRVEGYDSFARSLTIGAGDDDHAVPARAADARPVRGRPRLPAARGRAWRSSRCPGPINAFFRWEFNSCETLVHGRPACTRSTTPTPARTSRSPRCTTTSRGRSRRCVSGGCSAPVTGRRPRLDTNTRDCFDVADDPDLNYGGQAGRLRATGRRSTSRPTRYRRVLRDRAGLAAEIVYDWITSAGVRRAAAWRPCEGHVPAARAGAFIAHFRGLLGLWVHDNSK